MPWLPLDRLPRMEGALNAGDRRLEAREMSQQDVDHRCVLDSIEAGVGVDLGAIVLREEAIALEPARGHQVEDAERRFTEAKAFRQRLGHQSDHEVDLLEI